MIHEYLRNGTVNNIDKKECIFSHQEVPDIVNKKINLTQTAIRDYAGKLSIEIPCQVFDLTIDKFNGIINALNNQWESNLVNTNSSNLVKS